MAKSTPVSFNQLAYVVCTIARTGSQFYLDCTRPQWGPAAHSTAVVMVWFLLYM